MKHLASALLVAAASLAACKFDPKGVGNVADDDIADDDQPPPPDADVNAPDAPPTPPDAERPDAMPPDLDADDDTVLDADDNCVQIANTDQHDEDTDGVGDVCDNCPHIFNTDQADSSEIAVDEAADDVGDACDPGPGTREQIALFESFKGNAAPAAWVGVLGTWSVSGDELHQTSTDVTNATIYYSGDTWDSMTLHTTIDVDGFAPDGAGSDVRSFGAMADYAAGQGQGDGYACVLRDDVGNTNDMELMIAKITDAGGSPAITTGATVSTDLAAGQTYFDAISAVPGGQSCATFSPGLVSQVSTDTSYSSGTVAMRTNRAAVSFRYVVVFSPAN
jgi:hypothetical protein